MAKKKEDIQATVLNAVGLAMGVAVIVLSVMGLDQNTMNILLGIGLACLGLNGVEKL